MKKARMAMGKLHFADEMRKSVSVVVIDGVDSEGKLEMLIEYDDGGWVTLTNGVPVWRDIDATLANHVLEGLRQEAERMMQQPPTFEEQRELARELANES